MTFPSAAALLVFGAGGHGRVVADAALLCRHWSAVTASDRNPISCHGELLPGVPLVAAASVSRLTGLVHIAIGSSAAREKEAASWRPDRLATVLHPAATVSQFSRLAAGCFVAAGAVVGPAASVGSCVIINHGAVVDHDVEIGAFSHIAPNAALGGHVKVGRRVLIGAGAVVLPSVVIGDDVTVGAGAVVSTHLLEAGIYAGIPARRIQ